MESLKALNLKYNAFRDITPSISGNNLIWAEMHEVKAKIEKTYTETIKSNAKQLVLNWGAYGGGKTFSAYYFMNEKNEEKSLTHIYVRCPKDGAYATDELFKSIIDHLSYEKIQSQIKKLINSYGEDKLMSYLTPKTSREYAKAICLIGSNDIEISDLMNRFLYVGLTKTELKKLGLAKDIQSDSDSIKFLSGIISCFIGDTSFINGKVVFWIDEMEDLVYYSSKNYKAFSQVLRDLFDSISEGFLVFMNFTLAEGEESTIELILGGALWSRVTKKIRYKQFTQDNAVEYVSQLLNYSKINKNSADPLGSEIIAKLISVIPENNLTPREINKHFNSLVNYAMENNLRSINFMDLNKWIIEYNEDN